MADFRSWVAALLNQNGVKLFSLIHRSLAWINTSQ